ncbi:MAG TPA: cation:proton antiporter [Gaiellaceae bacterium]|jgi:NhaP-type Na+/H+ or K+/H+ antiporter|nr:cation:proton antiporter [Gaiellaceae bacterium]
MRTQDAGLSTWALATTAGILLVYAGLSHRLERTWVSAPIFFLSAGLIVGSKGLGWVGLSSTSEQVRVLAEVTLTLVLFADASRINVPALRREYMVPARLLGIGLPLTILAGWGIGAVLFGSFSGVEVLILAVILAPTDAALGQAVVTDPSLPSRIRQGLNVESGLNDGICVPLLLIALAVAEAEGGSETSHGALVLVVEGIGYGVLFGVIAGVVGGLVMRHAGRHSLRESGWRQILPVATAALAYGLAAPLGGSGFIAAFVAGFAFGALHRDTEGETTYLLDELGGLTNSVTFLVFGAAIVGTVLADLTWRAVLYGILSLSVVRMLPVAVSLFGTHARLRTVAFVGWFGPRGLASIVFTVIALEHGTLEHASAITVAVVFTIVLSVYAHGLSAKPLTNRYARWYRAHTEERLPRMESVHAPPQRWRRTQAVPVAPPDKGI